LYVNFLHNKAAKLLKTIGARKENIDLTFKSVKQKFLSRGIAPLYLAEQEKATVHVLVFCKVTSSKVLWLIAHLVRLSF
jgi:hypothetical protein